MFDAMFLYEIREFRVRSCTAFENVCALGSVLVRDSRMGGLFLYDIRELARYLLPLFSFRYIRPASSLNLNIQIGGGKEIHKDSFNNCECIRTGSVWKSGRLVLNCEIEICHQLRCSNKPLEKSIDKGDNPVCHLQLSAYGVSSKSHVPWDWCMKWVVNFI